MSFVAQNKIRATMVDAYLKHAVPRPRLNERWNLESSELQQVRIEWPGRYEWDAACDWVEPLRSSLSSLVPVRTVDDIPQPYKGTVILRVFVSAWRTIAICYSDYLDVDPNCVTECDLVFKMQHDCHGYGAPNIVAGGYVPDGKRLYYYLPSLRRTRDARIFKFDVFGRFGLDYSREIRERATQALRSQERFRFEGGMKKVRYIDFLNEAARSKICIDLPGLGDLCFRLVNYLAIGTCVVAYPHRAVLHTPLVDREHIVYCREDLSDLVDLCEYYVTHDAERERIARNARNCFDQYLHKDNLARYYLRTLLDRFA